MLKVGYPALLGCSLIIPHLPGVPHLYVNRPLEGRFQGSSGPLLKELLQRRQQKRQLKVQVRAYSSISVLFIRRSCGRFVSSQQR